MSTPEELYDEAKVEMEDERRDAIHEGHGGDEHPDTDDCFRCAEYMAEAHEEYGWMAQAVRTGYRRAEIEEVAADRELVLDEYHGVAPVWTEGRNWSHR